MMKTKDDLEEGSSFADEPTSTVSDAAADAAGPPSVAADAKEGARRRRSILLGAAALALLIVAAVVPAVVVPRRRGDEQSASSSVPGGSSSDGGGAAPPAGPPPTEEASADVFFATSAPSAPTPAPSARPTTLRDACLATEEGGSAAGSACPSPSAPQSSSDGGGGDDALRNETSSSSGGGGAAWTAVGEQVEGEAAMDVSGRAIALSCDGSVLAVGAQSNDGTTKLDANGTVSGGDNVGHVRVFELSTSGGNATWVQMGQDIDGEADKDGSGGALSLSASGRRVAIGASLNDGAAPSSGHVRVYDYVDDDEEGREGGGGGRWTQVGEDVDGSEEKAFSGRAVSLSADGARLAVGSNGADAPAAADVGKVRVYELGADGRSWNRLGQDLFGDNSKDNFGRSVSLSPDGSTLAIGGFGKDRGGGGGGDGEGEEGAAAVVQDVGHVRVFRFDDATDMWTQIGEDIHGKEEDDWFGLSVAMSFDGRRLIAGAPGSTSQLIQLPGYASVFEQANGTWSKIGGDDLDGGYSVALSFDGMTAAVGSYKSHNKGLNSGHVKVYHYEVGEGGGSMWTQVGDEMNGENRNMFGSSVALSATGDRVASGAPAHVGPNGEAQLGTVRVYDWCS